MRNTLILQLSLFLTLSPSLLHAQTTYPVMAPWYEDRLYQDEEKSSKQRERVYTDKSTEDESLRSHGAQSIKNNKQFHPENSIQHIEQSSALEEHYSSRVVQPLHQFGYDLFGVPRNETRETLEKLVENAPSIPSGAVQDDFILGSGDEVEIVFTGQRTDRDLYKVNSQGLLLIQDFPPIPAAGRSMGQVRISIEAAAKNLHNTKAHIALSSVRQIGVIVVGHVKKPGRRNLTVFHTVLDALMDSGGIDKTGSLRQIKLVRHGRSTLIDLYSLLMHGGTNIDLQLKDGDRIIVPPIGPTLAVAGEVKRPGIYEILPRYRGMHHNRSSNSEKLSLNEVLDLAGGVLSPGQNRMIAFSSGTNGIESTRDVRDGFTRLFDDGSILMISKGKDKREGSIELTGHTRKPGLYALHRNKTLSALLPDETALEKDIYPLIGVIERWNPETLSEELLEFPLQLLINGEFDRKLHDGDMVRLFSLKQIRDLQSSKENSKNKKNLEQGSLLSAQDDLDIKIDDPALQSFLAERSISVRGAVRYPGSYPVAEGASLESILATAGGLMLEADTTNIEVTSKHQGQNHNDRGRSGTRRIAVNFRETNPKDVSLGAGDSIRINRKFAKPKNNSVLILGEVTSPGHYDLIPGDTILDLLERAGGLTKQAYPKGAVFSRNSERRAEESRFRAAARDLERSLAVAIERDDDKTPNATQIAMARSLADELREAEALGRITVEADPSALKADPALNMLLEGQDRLFIPKRPLTVRVRGEVLSPASLQFRERKKPLDYINEAGGFTFHADKDRTFVLYPDGSAQPLQVSAWNYKPIFIPPGSTVVVPRDPKPFDFIESAKDISQILSNLAVTAIFIDDVRDGD